MEFERISEKVSKPRKERGVITTNIENWLAEEPKTLVIKCGSMQETQKAYGSAYQYKRSHRLDYVIFKKGTDVYLVKA